MPEAILACSINAGASALLSVLSALCSAVQLVAAFTCSVAVSDRSSPIGAVTRVSASRSAARLVAVFAWRVV
eukprot:8172102-Alexandrium_andersonii.AAC.1